MTNAQLTSLVNETVADIFKGKEVVISTRSVRGNGVCVCVKSKYLVENRHNNDVHYEYSAIGPCAPCFYAISGVDNIVTAIRSHYERYV